MKNAQRKRCPGCAGPTAVIASTRITYRRAGRETIADETELDAERCLNPACFLAHVDLTVAT